MDHPQRVVGERGAVGGGRGVELAHPLLDQGGAKDRAVAEVLPGLLAIQHPLEQRAGAVGLPAGEGGLGHLLETARILDVGVRIGGLLGAGGPGHEPQQRGQRDEHQARSEQWTSRTACPV